MYAIVYHKQVTKDIEKLKTSKLDAKVKALIDILYARPLDQQLQRRGYTLYNVNNLKLVRFKEVFSKAAKTDTIDTRKIRELFHLKDHLPLAKDVRQKVAVTHWRTRS